VFQGRFKDQIVQEERYLLTLCRYVALNPVRAHLVKRPEDWRWSSYAATIGVRLAPGFLAVRPLLAQFGEGQTALLQTRFAKYVTGERDEEYFDERIRSGERVFGDGDFKARLGAPRGAASDPPTAAECTRIA
jgi:hypothetical protein